MEIKMRNSPLFIVSLWLFCCFTAACQSQQTSIEHQNNNPAASTLPKGVTSATYHGVGTVEAVNQKNRRLTINHEEIKGYMQAMSMEHYVKDASLLDSIEPGDRVEFTLNDTAGIAVITELKKL